MSPEGFKKIQLSDKLTRGEKLYLNSIVFRVAGGFWPALFEVIAVADLLNTAKLAKAFPDEVNAYWEWVKGDLPKRAGEIAGEPCE